MKSLDANIVSEYELALGVPIERDNATYVQIVFRVDPNIRWLPTWLFNLFLNSTIANLIPMMEKQARLFLPGQKYHHYIEEHAGYNL